MKKVYLFALFSLTTVCLYSQTTVPGIWFSNNKTVNAIYNTSKIKIDGDLSEDVWTTAGFNPNDVSFPNSNKLSNKINPFSNRDLTGMPADSEFDADVSFGTTWDNDNLYIAVVVKSPSYVNSSGIFNNYIEGVSLFFDVDNKRSSHFSIDQNFPRAYESSDFDINFKVEFSDLDAKLSSCNNGVLAATFHAFKESSYSAHTKSISGGYILEIALKWVDLLKVSHYNHLKLENNTKIGFDIGYSIPNSTGTNRKAVVSWNACCVYRNWTESINFGNLLLNGNTNPLQSIAFKQPVINISNSKQTFELEFKPQNASNPAEYLLVHSNPNLPSVKLENNTLIPLNNGVSTLIGVVKNGNFSSDVISITSAIVSVSGKSAISLTVDPVVINKNYGKSDINYYVENHINNNVRVKILTNANLIELDTTNYTIKSKGIGNGVVNFKVMLKDDTSKSAISSLTLTNQMPVTTSILTITSPNITLCNRTKKSITITGVNSTLGFSTSPLSSVPYPSFSYLNTLLGLIDYISNDKQSFQIIAGSGTNQIFPGYFGLANNATFTLVGTYLSYKDTVSVKFISNLTSETCNSRFSDCPELIYFGTEEIFYPGQERVYNKFCTEKPFLLDIGAKGKVTNYMWSKNGEALQQLSSTKEIGENTYFTITMPGVINSIGTYQATITGACGNLISKKVETNIEPNVSIAGSSYNIKVCTSELPVEKEIKLVDKSEFFVINSRFNNFTDVSKCRINNNSISIDNPSQFGVYLLTVEGFCNNLYSVPITISGVESQLSVTGIETVYNLCPNEQKTITISGIGSNVTEVIWNKGIVNINGSDAYVNINSSSSLLGNNLFTVLGQCGTQVSKSTIVNKLEVVSNSISVNNLTMCMGNIYSITGTVSGSGVSGSIWIKNNSFLSNNSIMTVSGNSTNIGLYVFSSTGICGSDTKTLTISGIHEPISFVGLPANIIICENSPFSLNATATGANIAYKWNKGSETFLGANVSLLGNLAESGNYGVEIYNQCESIKDTVDVQIKPITTVTSATNEPCTFLVTMSGGSLSGVSMETETIKYKLYPNPTTIGQVHFEADLKCEFKIISSDGVEVKKGFCGTFHTFELQQKGFYIVLLDFGNGRIRLEKIVYN